MSIDDIMVVPRWAARQLQHARIAIEIEQQQSANTDHRRIKREIRKACERYDKQHKPITVMCSPISGHNVTPDADNDD